MIQIYELVTAGVRSEIPEVQVELFHYGCLLGLCHEVEGVRRAVKVGTLVHDDDGNLVDVNYPDKDDVPAIVERLLKLLKGKCLQVSE